MQTLDTQTTPARPERVADADITTAVEMLFHTKRGVNAHLIDIVTREGIVELAGFTDNLLARSRAEQLALAVRGVRGVINELVVRTQEVPDQQLLRDVELALSSDAATADYNVRCAVAQGVATLTGMVQSWVEKQLVLRVLEGVRGVRGIEAGHLDIRGSGLVNSDEEITAQIQELLDWDIRVNSVLVQVRTSQQVVHLTGTVGTAEEKARVVATAHQAGAVRVDARDLFVACWALDPHLRPDKLAPKADAEIGAAVRDTFRFDPRVLSYEPTVQVQAGVVTLTGTVSNLRAKQAAEQDARDVVGVWDVHNLLRVRAGQLLTDSDIRRDVVAALARDPYVGCTDFSVNVYNGKVYLYGRTNSHFEQEQAGAVAAGVNGVAAIENRVEVFGGDQPAGTVPAGATAPFPADGLSPDHALAARVRTCYFWSAALHAQDVEVQVDNGRVTLNGTVHTWHERKQAALDALEMGAHTVNNHLRVAAGHDRG
ncbi:BON domain-containing protein [Hymenobacter antarcticus]|uniref:BON domain-containing protein n=1 Tax=Hymenobacter antarcticus TaxID=486270 RepID=A0ABP7PJ77_9BACT